MNAGTRTAAPRAGGLLSLSSEHGLAAITVAGGVAGALSTAALCSWTAPGVLVTPAGPAAFDHLGWIA
jgi:hypothetical protein